MLARPSLLHVTCLPHSCYVIMFPLLLVSVGIYLYQRSNLSWGNNPLLSYNSYLKWLRITLWVDWSVLCILGMCVILRFLASGFLIDMVIGPAGGAYFICISALAYISIRMQHCQSKPNPNPTLTLAQTLTLNPTVKLPIRFFQKFTEYVSGASKLSAENKLLSSSKDSNSLVGLPPSHSHKWSKVQRPRDWSHIWRARERASFHQASQLCRHGWWGVPLAETVGDLGNIFSLDCRVHCTESGLIVE